MLAFYMPFQATFLCKVFIKIFTFMGPQTIMNRSNMSIEISFLKLTSSYNLHIGSYCFLIFRENFLSELSKNISLQVLGQRSHSNFLSCIPATWFFKWSFWLNDFWQTSHLNFGELLWEFLICWERLILTANIWLHSSHLNLLKPSWIAVMWHDIVAL